METEDSGVSFVKHNGKYYKAIEIFDEKTINYELVCPLNNENNEPLILNSIDRTKEIKKAKINTFKQTIEFCKKYKLKLEKVYDCYIILCGLSLKNLCSIMNAFRISNKNIIFSIDNIETNPYNFITEERSVISYAKCEYIKDVLNLSIPFRELCIKFTYDSIRNPKLCMGYLPYADFHILLKDFCSTRNKDYLKYIGIVKKMCLKLKIKGIDYITTNYWYQLEKNSGDQILKLAEMPVDSIIDEETILKDMHEYEEENSIEFNAEQKQAIVNCMQNNFSIITGPPGTGKTTVVACIIFIFIELGLCEFHPNKNFANNIDNGITDSDNSDDETQNSPPEFYTSISFIAPTGKAYLNGWKRLKKYELDPELSGTIHKTTYCSFNYILTANKFLENESDVASSILNIPKEFTRNYIQDAIADRYRHLNEIEHKWYEKLKSFLHHFALKTPKWQRYLHSFTPTKWAF